MEVPEPITFKIVRFVGGEPVKLKSGALSLATVTHVWAICNRCGEGSYVNEDDLKAQWDCPTCYRSSSRKTSGKTPVCTGRTFKKQKITHEPVEMTSKDPAPGRPCRMTYHCVGKHRRASEGEPS